MSAAPPRHHWIVRVTHWVNAVALTIMVGSGLRIFNAYPAFARKGETFCCYPFEGHEIPGLAHLRRLAGRRAPLALRDDVGAGRQRARLPRLRLPARRVARPRPAARRRSATRWEMVRFYLALRKDHPHQGKHNALQRPRTSRCRRRRGRRGVGAGDLEAGAARAAHAPPRRLRVGPLLALPGDAGARRAHVRTRLHGVRGRSVLAARR